MTVLQILLKLYPKTYSEELGIKLSSGKESEIFKWFLASILFAKPIKDSTAMKTYKIFESKGVTTPETILQAGWHRLVELLDAGSYTRYDFSTADKLLEMAENLVESYKGSLEKLRKESKSEEELYSRIKALAKGIGDLTVQIFSRELREVWNVDPPISSFALLAAKNLRLAENEKDFKKKFRRKLVKIESALLRLGKDYCRKKRCEICPVKNFCRKS